MPTASSKRGVLNKMGGNEALKLKREGDEQWKLGESNKAIILWSRAIASNDCDDDVLILLYSNRSAAHYKLKNKRECLSDAEVCIAMKPNWSKSHLRLGKALILNNKLDLALESFKKALEIEPDNREYSSAINDVKYQLSKQQQGINYDGNNNSEEVNYGSNINNNTSNQNNRPPPAAGHQNNYRPPNIHQHQEDPFYQPYLQNALLWYNRNQKAVMQFGMIMIGVFVLLNSGVLNMDAGIGGELGTVLIVAGGVYAAHRSGMSPFQIMMMLNMLNRGGRRRRRTMW